MKKQLKSVYMQVGSEIWPNGCSALFCINSISEAVRHKVEKQVYQQVYEITEVQCQLCVQLRRFSRIKQIY